MPRTQQPSDQEAAGRGKAAADADQRFMAAAIRLGRRELGRTWPNPAVGALIVSQDGVIVGRGWTQPGGRPHAETMACAEAGKRTLGATAYVSLEPCSHHGKSPPCVDGLIAAGVSRVVSAIEDPNPEVAGKGHSALRAAGIDVVSGVLEGAARTAHAGHFMRMTAGRPWVTLKLAVSRDGSIAGPERTPLQITGPHARACAHMLRANHDAILIGMGTAETDDPELTCRLPGMSERSPVRVVLDSRLRLSRNSHLIRTIEAAPVWIVAAEPLDADRVRRLERAGSKVIGVTPDDDGRVNTGEALKALAGKGITRILVEGGAEIAGSLVAADLVDEAVIFESDMQIGTGGVPAIAGGGLALLTESRAYMRADTCSVDGDWMTTYLRAR